MMRDEDKPFVWLKSGSGIKISPRNAAGWKALALWMFAMVPINGLYIWAMASGPSRAAAIAATVAFLLALTVWTVAMFRWMMARSEVIDVNELLELKRERDRRKDRR